MKKPDRPKATPTPKPVKPTLPGTAKMRGHVEAETKKTRAVGRSMAKRKP